MTTARLRAAALLSTLVLVAMTLVALPASSSQAAAPAAGAVSMLSPASSVRATAAAASTAPDAAHPFGDPVYWPLRNPVKVGCVYSNCPGPYHGYWAIDFGGALNDPIYAAGAGIFHIGNVDHSCPASGVTAGTWVYVDHGAAGVTRYHHVNTILAKEGQLVTPSTEIATMGNNGNTAPCTTSYLHMEWQASRLGGTRQPIPTMKACSASGSGTLSFPADLGHSSWNSIPNMTVRTPVTSSSCLGSLGQTPNRPSFSLQRAAGAAIVTPSARPAGTDRWRDRVQEYHPSLSGYGQPVDHDHYATTSTKTVTGLTNGHTYRVSVAFHNAAGWSAWAPLAAVVPAATPPAPVFRGLSSSNATIYYSWYRSTSYGSSTATYEVARRCRKPTGTYVPWVYTNVPGTDISYAWRHVTTGNICEVTVRGHNGVGYGAWGTRHFVTTR